MPRTTLQQRIESVSNASRFLTTRNRTLVIFLTSLALHQLALDLSLEAVEAETQRMPCENDSDTGVTFPEQNMQRNAKDTHTNYMLYCSMLNILLFDHKSSRSQWFRSWHGKLHKPGSVPGPDIIIINHVVVVTYWGSSTSTACTACFV